MTNNWSEVIKENFDSAAPGYDEHAKLQNAVAWRLAKLCSIQEIPSGLWIDLGAGTGFLADSLERFNPNQKVLRIDKSPGMLARQKEKASSKLWDLNSGLPAFKHCPTLMASSFALHWLENPQTKVEEWFSAIAPGGWLALALPIKGCFPQWYQAAAFTGMPCTALDFPSSNSLLKSIPKNAIHYKKLHNFTQSASEVPSLLKAIKKIGGQASKEPPMGITYWRRLNDAWQRSIKKQVLLTWKIQLILIKR